MAEPKVTLGGVTLGKATVTRKHVRRGQDMEKKSRVQTTVTGGDTKDKQVSMNSSNNYIYTTLAGYIQVEGLYEMDFYWMFCTV